MTFFAHDEEPKHPFKPCSLFCSVLKDAFAQCHTFCDKFSTSRSEEEYTISDTDDEQDVVILAIRAHAMEAKLRRKGRLIITDSFRWELFPITGEFKIPKRVKYAEDNEDEEEEKEAFFPAGSCFSQCSNVSEEVFFSVGSCLSRCSSTSRIELWDVRRRSILHEFSHCEGWPFGLCRKALLLPPLPRSPSESWSWRRGPRLAKMV